MTLAIDVDLRTGDGRTVAIETGEPAEARNRIRLGEDRIRFDSLSLRPHDGSSVRIADLQYWGTRPGWTDRLIEEVFDDLFRTFRNGRDDIPYFPGMLLGLAAVASRHDDRVPDGEPGRLTRRQLLLGAGTTAVGTATPGAPATAAGETYRYVETGIEDNPKGVQVGVHGGSDTILPDRHGWTVRIGGRPIRTVSHGERATVPLGLTGRLSVSRSDPGFVEGLGGPPATRFEARMDADPERVGEGTVVTITTAEIVLDTLALAEPDEIVVRAGGASIPHKTEDDHPIGFYEVRTIDGTETLVYVAGAEPPTTREVDIVVFVGRHTELLDDLSRI